MYDVLGAWDDIWGLDGGGIVGEDAGGSEAACIGYGAVGVAGLGILRFLFNVSLFFLLYNRNPWRPVGISVPARTLF